MIMRRTIVATIASALGVVAPEAFAAPDHVKYDCRLVNFAQQTLTGSQEIFTGVAVGYVASEHPGDAVSIRCYVTVNGYVVHATTPNGTGTDAAVTAGQITYSASDTDDVDLCAEWTAGTQWSFECFSTLLIHVPPDEAGLNEAVWHDVWPVLGPLMCPIGICDPPTLLPVKIDPR